MLSYNVLVLLSGNVLPKHFEKYFNTKALEKYEQSVTIQYRGPYALHN